MKMRGEKKLIVREQQERLENENSMMKYQIIFLKLQNFLLKMGKLFKRKRASHESWVLERIKHRSIVSKCRPVEEQLKIRRFGFVCFNLEKFMETVRFKRYTCGFLYGEGAGGVCLGV